MENYLMLNGKRIDLTAEQIETLVGKKEKDPFERVKKGKNYYAIINNDTVYEYRDEDTEHDVGCHAVANYCTDRELMEQRALHETLNRLLWRYSMQNGGKEIENQLKIAITYDRLLSKFRVVEMAESICYFGEVYFSSKRVANAAIEEIVKPFMEKHPEFRW